MAVKKIIDIDVQDEAFKRFMDLFSQFQDKVADLPDEWKKVDAAMTGAGKGFAKASGQTNVLMAGMAASSAAIVEAIHESTKAQRQFEKATRRSHKAMHELARTSGKVAHTIFGIGAWAMKFGAIGAGLGGIAGAIGFGDLAGSALSRQRSARGVGMTPGQNAAFSTYFNQFGNAESVASNVANARNDTSKRWIFGALGIGPAALATDNNFQLSIETERRAQQLVKSYPRGVWWNIAKAHGLNELFSEPDLRVLRHTSSARFNAATTGAEGSVGSLGFSNKVAREWAQLSVQFRKSVVEVESSLITGLHGLAPELKRISADVANWISAFAKSPDMGKIVGEAENGLATFAKFLGSPQFGKNLQTFENELATAATEMAAIVKLLYPAAKVARWTIGKASAVWNADPLGLNKVTPGQAWHGLESGYNAVSHFVWGSDNNPGNLRHQNQFGAWVENRYPTEHAGMRAMASLLQRYPVSKQFHYADTIASIIPIWNAHGANDAQYIRRVSRWSGYGPNQHLNLNDPTVRDRVMAAMIREEHSTKITPAQVQATLDGGNGLPKSVDRLVQTLRRQQAAKPATVIIRNQTSANVALQANAAAF